MKSKISLVILLVFVVLGLTFAQKQGSYTPSASYNETSESSGNETIATASAFASNATLGNFTSGNEFFEASNFTAGENQTLFEEMPGHQRRMINRHLNKYYVAILHPEDEQLATFQAQSEFNFNETFRTPGFFDINSPRGVIVFYANLTHEVAEGADSCRRRSERISDLPNWTASLSFELWLHNVQDVFSADIHFGIVRDHNLDRFSMRMGRDLEGPVMLSLFNISTAIGSTSIDQQSGFVYMTGEINDELLALNGISLGGFQTQHLVALLEGGFAYANVTILPGLSSSNMSAPSEGEPAAEAAAAAEGEGEAEFNFTMSGNLTSNLNLTGSNITVGLNATNAQPFQPAQPGLFQSGATSQESELVSPQSANETSAEQPLEEEPSTESLHMSLLGQIGEVDYRTMALNDYGFQW